MSVMIGKMCRTCLAVDTAMLSLFGTHKSGSNMPGPSSVAGMLSSFTSMTISESDGLPKQACLSCVSEINRAYFFKIKCEKSQNTLEEYLEQSVPMNESSEIDKNGVVSQDVKMECDEEVLIFKGSTAVASRIPPETENQFQDEEQLVQERTEPQEQPRPQKNQSGTEETSKQSIKCPLCPISFLDHKSCLSHFLTCHPTELPSALVETVFRPESRENDENPTENVSQPGEVSNNDSSSSTKQTVSIETGSENNTYMYAGFSCTVCQKTFHDSNDLIFHLPSCKKKRRSGQHVKVALENENKIEKDRLSTEPSDKNINSLQNESVGRRTSRRTMNNVSSTVKSKVSKKKSLSLSISTAPKNRNKRTFECGFCKKIYVSNNRLASHLIIHKNETDPSNNIKQRNKLKESFKELTEQGGALLKNQCVLCAKVFLSRDVLKVHLRAHSGEKLSCILCCKIFEDLCKLKKHLRRHALTKSHKCEMCEKSFVKRNELQAHIQKHMETSFACNTCGATFKESIQLTQHQQIHSEERRFACEICKLRFTSARNLCSHLLVHKGEKPFKCQICEKAFTRKSYCKKHMLAHTKT